MATPKNFINSVVYAKPDFSQADGLPRFYTTVDLQGGNIENVVLINGELPMTIPPTGGFVRYDACDGAVYDISVNLMAGSSNIQLGYNTGDFGTGSRNVMLGYFAANGTGTKIDDSVAIGSQAGANADGSNNVYIGPYAGFSTGGSNNVFIGSRTAYDMSGINNNNIFLGRNAGSFLTDISDTFIVGDASDTLIRGHMKNHTLDICGNLNISNSINSYQYFKNGTMGINNSNPDNDYKLDISGAAIVRGNLDICGNFYVTGNIIYDGAGVNVDISNGGLTLLGTGSAQATLQVRDGGVTINNDGTQGAYMTIGYEADYTRRNTNYMIDCSGNIATTGRVGFSGVTTTPQTNLTANISCPSTGALAFNTNATEAVRIASSGNVGIGTTTPSKLLSLGTTNNTQKLAIYDDGTGNNVYGFGSNSNLLHFHAGTSSGANGQMVLASSGNVGIAKTNPIYALDVSGQIRSTTATNNYGIYHTDSSINLASYVGGSINGGYLGTISNHPLAFYTNNSSAQIYIGANGKVGIANNNPVEALDISGNLYMRGGGTSVASRIVTTGGAMYMQTMNTAGNMGAFYFSNIDVSGGQIAALIDGVGNATFYNSLKALTPSSIISAPYYSFNFGITSNQELQNNNWTDLTSSNGYTIVDNIRGDSGSSINSYGGGVSPTGVYTVPISGMYVLGFYLRLVDGAAATLARITNGTKYYPELNGSPSGIDGGERMHITYSTTKYLTATDTINVSAITPSEDPATIDTLEFWGYLLHSV
jgi:hypothetical protein